MSDFGSPVVPGLGSPANKCNVCEKTVYPIEAVKACDKLFHKGCFRCKHCNGVLSLKGFATINNEPYCKPHYMELFRSKGNYAVFGDDEVKGGTSYTGAAFTMMTPSGPKSSDSKILRSSGGGSGLSSLGSSGGDLGNGTPQSRGSAAAAPTPDTAATAPAASPLPTPASTSMNVIKAGSGSGTAAPADSKPAPPATPAAAAPANSLATSTPASTSSMVIKAETAATNGTATPPSPLVTTTPAASPAVSAAAPPASPMTTPASTSSVVIKAAISGSGSGIAAPTANPVSAPAASPAVPHASPMVTPASTSSVVIKAAPPASPMPTPASTSSEVIKPPTSGGGSGIVLSSSTTPAPSTPVVASPLPRAATPASTSQVVIKGDTSGLPSSPAVSIAAASRAVTPASTSQVVIKADANPSPVSNPAPSAIVTPAPIKADTEIPASAPPALRERGSSSPSSPVVTRKEATPAPVATPVAATSTTTTTSTSSPSITRKTSTPASPAANSPVISRANPAPTPLPTPTEDKPATTPQRTTSVPETTTSAAAGPVGKALSHSTSGKSASAPSSAVTSPTLEKAPAPSASPLASSADRGEVGRTARLSMQFSGPLDLSSPDVEQQQTGTTAAAGAGAGGSRLSMSFSEKCAKCSKTVYPLERIQACEKSFHKACFRCKHCDGVLSLKAFATINNEPYCKIHYLELFKSKGNYAVFADGDVKGGTGYTGVGFVGVSKVASAQSSPSVSAIAAPATSTTPQPTLTPEPMPEIEPASTVDALVDPIVPPVIEPSFVAPAIAEPKIVALPAHLDLAVPPTTHSHSHSHAVSAATLPVVASNEAVGDSPSQDSDKTRNRRSMVVSGPGATSKCNVCEKTVYPIEAVKACDKLFHKGCFRCKHCNGVLSLKGFATINNEPYCKPHYMELFRSKGNYAVFGDGEVRGGTSYTGAAFTMMTPGGSRSGDLRASKGSFLDGSASKQGSAGDASVN